ncbi:MAG TPA: YeeE/YedE family protein [Noviherbaspirillum sp.]|nr:YeeE/YedE family protein [Noviherbaspirillum sp.]
MNPGWTNLIPWSSLSGGVLIGMAAAMLILFNGRIAGISGILGNLIRPKRGDTGWQAAFILGLILAPFAFRLVAPLPSVRIDTSAGMLVLAGLLVGIGTRYGSGCTSGHGICGLSRFSPRSMVATAVFMGAGFATVFIVRHLLG